MQQSKYFLEVFQSFKPFNEKIRNPFLVREIDPPVTEWYALSFNKKYYLYRIECIYKYFR